MEETASVDMDGADNHASFTKLMRLAEDMWAHRMNVSVHHGVAVALAALATAWNSRQNGFVWDDRAAIIGNRDVDASDSHWWELFQHDFWGFAINTKTSHKSYRPLTVLTFRWDRSLHGIDPRGFHWTNVMIHALCAYLVWRTACVVLKSKANRSEWGALLAGLLFAVHPIHCDSVASIVGRADLLCVAFSLAGFLAYADAERTNSWYYVAGAVVLGVCACLCKELGITVFGIYVAHELLKSLATSPRVLLRARIQRLVCVVASTVCLLLARLWVNGDQTKATFNILANSINVEESKLVRIMSYAHVHAWYLWKLVWPSWFSYDYGFNTIPVISSATDPRNLLTAIAYTAVIAGVYKGLRDVKHSPLLMCIAFGVIPFVPASNIFFPVGTIVAERLLYFPSVGFCLIIGYVGDQFTSILDRMEKRTRQSAQQSRPSYLPEFVEWSAVRRLAVALVSAILVAAMVKSMARNADWNNEAALFTAAVDVVPKNVKALNNAAKVYLNSDPERALQLARTAIALLPQHVEGQVNVGLAFTHTPAILLGIRHMLKAVAFSTVEVSGAGYAGTHLYDYWTEQQNTTTSTERKMQSPSVKLALAFLDMAIKRGSRTPLHFYQRGIISDHLHDLPGSLRYLELAKFLNDRAVRLGLDSEMVLHQGSLHNRVAIARRQLGHDDEALAELLAGIELYPTEPSLYFNAASTYISRGQLNAAAALLDRCLRECEGADMLLAGADMLEGLKQHDAARAFRERASKSQAELSMQDSDSSRV